MHMGILSVLKKPFNDRLKMLHQYQILKRLEELFEHGYSLNDALDILKWEKHIRETIERLEKFLYQGDNFIEALEKLHFNQDIINYLTITYQNGNLKDGLRNCCEMLYQRQQLLKKLKNVSRYPLFLFLFFLIILYFMKASIFPSFTQILGATSHTGHTFYYAEWTINIIFYLIIFLMVMAFLGQLFSILMKNNLPVEKKIFLIEHLPLYKQYKRMHTTYYFVTHLGSFLTSGLTMRDSLQLMKSQSSHTILHYYAAKISDHLARGYDYSTILPQCTLLEDHLTRIMTKHRNQEQLYKELTLYTEHLIHSMETFIKRWLELLQPIILSILAIFVVFVYLTLMLPMFDYIQSM